MKFLKLILLSLFIYGCNANTGSSTPVKDDRTPEQLALIRRLAVSDSLYRSESNEIKKTDIGEREKAKLISYIADTLHSSFNKWPATIFEMNVKTYPTNYISVKFMIPLQETFEEKLPEYHSVVIESTVLFDEKAIKDSLANVNVGDKVWISGTFQENAQDRVIITGKTFIDNPFYNPEFKAILTSVTSKAN